MSDAIQTPSELARRLDYSALAMNHGECEGLDIAKATYHIEARDKQIAEAHAREIEARDQRIKELETILIGIKSCHMCRYVEHEYSAIRCEQMCNDRHRAFVPIATTRAARAEVGYPTEWTYEQACKAIEKHRADAEALRAALETCLNVWMQNVEYHDWDPSIKQARAALAQHKE